MASGEENDEKIKEDTMEEGSEEEDCENDEDENMEEEGEGKAETEEKVYFPGDPIEEGDELTFDKSAYHMYHSAQTGAPCLSFDIVPDSLGSIRTEFPMTSYMVCGTQTDGKPNQLLVMKMSNLTKISEDSDSEDSYIDDDEDIDGPQLRTVSIHHMGGVNRIRHATIENKRLAASWSETGTVFLWDIMKPLESLDLPGVQQHQIAPSSTKPIFSFSGHQSEGFAMDWSPTTPGRLATGSCNRNIHLWQLRDSSTWHVDQRPLNAHTDSVEDIQWSPNEKNVFASCSVDKTIRIWDARAVGPKACMLTANAHESDVNVITWNRHDPFILSGGDDGMLKVWDLRQFQNGVPIATFKHHTAPITSVEWHPTDSTVFVASGDDHQITIWDLAVEKDEEGEEGLSDKNQLPPQLLFIHMGQTDIKEVHWHNQLPGVLVSTAASGFNVFKTISV